jgi:hypothetical protein
MDPPSGNQRNRAAAARRRLYELQETGGWVHHIADLNTGEVLTTPLDRPLAPLSRAERLSQLGLPIDPTGLGGPSRRLTPGQPYQDSPQTWLDVMHSHVYESGGPGPSFVWWVGDTGGSAEFYFGDPPQQRCLASISLGGASASSSPGLVHVGAGGIEGELEIPMERINAHTVDLILGPTGGSQQTIWVDHFEGIQELFFTAISFGPAPPIFEG